MDQPGKSVSKRCVQWIAIRIVIRGCLRTIQSHRQFTRLISNKRATSIQIQFTSPKQCEVNRDWQRLFRTLHIPQARFNILVRIVWTSEYFDAQISARLQIHKKWNQKRVGNIDTESVNNCTCMLYSEIAAFRVCTRKYCKVQAQRLAAAVCVFFQKFNPTSTLSSHFSTLTCV